VGPLESGDDVSVIREWLENRGASVEVHIDARRMVAYHWVYLRPQASPEAAAALVRRLNREGITDVDRVTSGKMTNAISAGMFSMPKFRDRRLTGLTAMGYEPRVGLRHRITRGAWLDVQAPRHTLNMTDVMAHLPDTRVAGAACAGARGRQ
jgi:hypothetical protein